MQLTHSGRLLLLLARFLDYHERVHSITLTLRHLAGDPRLGRHRRWAREYLRHREKLHQATHTLKRRGYLEEKVFGQSRGYVLTPKGEVKLLQLEMIETVQRPLLPGGQWLIVFFDVPEDQRRMRDFLRSQLRFLGFEPVQKSVWVTRTDVRLQLRKWLEVHQLGRYAKLLLVKEFKK